MTIEDEWKRSDKRWRVSTNGSCIKTGWDDTARIVARAGGTFADVEQWINDAELICELYNKWLDEQEQKDKV